MLVTHIVRFLSGVNAQMALQGLQVAEASATGVAGVGLLAGVDQDVGSQVSNLRPGQTHFKTCGVSCQRLILQTPAHLDKSRATGVTAVGFLP